jgi:prepilin peptidase CpaA
VPPPLKFALVVLVLTAAAYDLRFRRIPNWLNVAGALTGLVLNAFVFTHSGITAAVIGMLLALVVYVPLYLLRAMGAGDVKLMGAVGAIVGPQQWFLIFLCSAMAGGLFAAFVSLKRGRLRETLSNVAILASELMHFRPPARHHETLDVKSRRSLRLPHGLAIAAGSLAFLFIHG